MNQEKKKYGAVVVGSGPAGCTAAIYLGRAGISTALVTGALQIGGALTTTTEVENFPGFPDGVQGVDLMERMQNQAMKFGAEFFYNDCVRFELTGNVKKLTLDTGEILEADAVILATGFEYRRLNVEGEDEFSGRGVSYCATCDGMMFKDKEVCVAGGGDAAFTEAIYLSSICSKVHIIHRREGFSASKIMEERVKAIENIEIHTNKTVEKIEGKENDKGFKVLGNLVLKDTQTGELSDFPTNALFVSIGHTPKTDLIKEQVELTENGYILLKDRSSKTNLAGVFAAGNVTDNSYGQAVVAAGSGCMAALDAEKYLSALG